MKITCHLLIILIFLRYKQRQLAQMQTLMTSSLENNDSLFFSQFDEDNLLLSDEIEKVPVISRYQKLTKNLGLETNQSKRQGSMYFENNDSIMMNCGKEGEKTNGSTIKTYKKLAKDKQQFLSFDSRIKSVSLKNTTKNQKINQLASLIEAQKILQAEKRLKVFVEQLVEIADDAICQKKSLQRDLDNLIEMNKLMKWKLKEIQKYFSQAKLQKTPCTCARAFSFSKNRDSESGNTFFDNFHFAKTMISSVEQLQLKRVEEEEGINMMEMPIVELLWVLKSKAEGSIINVSEGLLDRIASGPTLKSWIKKIEEKFIPGPKISEFDLKQDREEEQTVLEEFVTLLQQRQDHFISSIKESRDFKRQYQILRYSSFVTFTQILVDEKCKHTKQQAMAEFGNMKRVLKLIEKKCGVEKVDDEEIYSPKNIIQLIESLY